MSHVSGCGLRTSQEASSQEGGHRYLQIWIEKAERAGAILHLQMSERMKALVKEEMNPVYLLRNLEERR